jgi:hypothetical protein
MGAAPPGMTPVPASASRIAGTLMIVTKPAKEGLSPPVDVVTSSLHEFRVRSSCSCHPKSKDRSYDADEERRDHEDSKAGSQSLERAPLAKQLRHGP